MCSTAAHEGEPGAGTQRHNGVARCDNVRSLTTLLRAGEPSGERKAANGNKEETERNGSPCLFSPSKTHRRKCPELWLSATAQSLSAVPLQGVEYRNASGMGFTVIEQERRGTADVWRSGGGLEEAPDLGVRLQQLFSAAPAHSSRIIHMWRTYWSRTLPKASS
ncbi:unnamed protein product [Boreogadus saida]